MYFSNILFYQKVEIIMKNMILQTYPDLAPAKRGFLLQFSMS